MSYSSDPDEKEVTGWLKPRVLKPELVDLGLLSNPSTHTHTLQVESVGHILVASVAKFCQAPVWSPAPDS